MNGREGSASLKEARSQWPMMSCCTNSDHPKQHRTLVLSLQLLRWPFSCQVNILGIYIPHSQPCTCGGSSLLIQTAAGLYLPLKFIITLTHLQLNLSEKLTMCRWFLFLPESEFLFRSEEEERVRTSSIISWNVQYE